MKRILSIFALTALCALSLRASSEALTAEESTEGVPNVETQKKQVSFKTEIQPLELLNGDFLLTIATKLKSPTGEGNITFKQQITPALIKDKVAILCRILSSQKYKMDDEMTTIFINQQKAIAWHYLSFLNKKGLMEEFFKTSSECSGSFELDDEKEPKK